MPRIPAHPLAKHPLENLPRKLKCSQPTSHRGFLTALMIESSLKQCGIYVKGITLDVGCGHKPYEKTFFAGAEKYIGMDYLTDRSTPDVVGSATAIPLGDAGFDTVVCTEVLEHIPDPLKALQEMYRVLKPGGYVAIAVPSKSGLYRFMPWDPGQWPPHHVSHWGLRDFKTLADQTQLRLIESGGDILYGAGIGRQIHLHHRLAFALGKRRHNQPSTWPDVLSWIYRKSGMKFIAPRWGASIYAFFQKV